MSFGVLNGCFFVCVFVRGRLVVIVRERMVVGDVKEKRAHGGGIVDR